MRIRRQLSSKTTIRALRLPELTDRPTTRTVRSAKVSRQVLGVDGGGYGYPPIFILYESRKVSEPKRISLARSMLYEQHELYDKFKHPALSHFAVVMLSRLDGRTVLFDICQLFRTRPETGRCSCCGRSNESNRRVRANRIDRRSLCVARFLVDSVDFAGDFRICDRADGLLREIDTAPPAHVTRATSY
jgi:hypothetical protein